MFENQPTESKSSVAVLLKYVRLVHAGQIYLCNTDEDDEEGGRAAVGALQVRVAGVFWKHPFGNQVLELLAASHLPPPIRLLRSAPQAPPILGGFEGLLLLQVDVPHHCCRSPAQQRWCDTSATSSSSFIRL